jgi:hypothetical protein
MTAKTQFQAAFVSDDGKWIFESNFAVLEKKSAARWRRKV